MFIYSILTDTSESAIVKYIAFKASPTRAPVRTSQISAVSILRTSRHVSPALVRIYIRVRD